MLETSWIDLAEDVVLGDFKFMNLSLCSDTRYTWQI